MREAMEVFGNPSSVHREGQDARFVLDRARRQVADALNIRGERVVFTSGGTEANNLALRGVAGRGRVLASAVEHDCVLETAKALGGGIVPVDAEGVVKLDVLEAELKKGGVAVVSVMWANNETGVCQPLAQAAELAHAHGALFHCDAVQAAGHVPVAPDALGIDLLTLSGHKFGGPKGVGALVVKPEIQDRMEAQMRGGAQERHRRAGTENLPGIAGMGAALEARGDMGAESLRLQEFMDMLVEGLQGLPAGVVAPRAAKVPHIVQILTPGRPGEDLVIAMDLAGVAVSQGSACSSGRVAASHVLKAMGYNEKEAGEGLRVSLGWATTAGDVQAGIAALQKVLG
jgi:cysteine desulfurase